MMLLCWPHRNITMRRLWETRDQNLCWRTVCGSVWAEGRLLNRWSSVISRSYTGVMKRWSVSWTGAAELSQKATLLIYQSIYGWTLTYEAASLPLAVLSLKDRHPEEAWSSCSFTSGGDSWGSLNIWIGCLFGSHLHLLPPQADFVWAEQF